MKLTIALVHGTFDGDQARINEGRKFGSHLPRHVTDLCSTNILHSNGISNLIHETYLQFKSAVRNLPVISVLWLSDEADLLSGVNKTYHTKVNMTGTFILSGETPVPL